jgi:flagellar biosynthesis regulator FlaF
MAQQAYREARFTHLEMCAQVVKLKYPEALDIVGVATESGTSTGRSEDAIYFDARTWTREMASRAAEDQQRLQILVAPTTQGEKVYDYPIDDLLPNVGE